jgi:hypothetical protein
MSDERTPYTLKKPITHGSETISALAIREPVARDIKGLDLSAKTVDANLVLASRLSGQPMPVIDQLSMVDMQEVLKIVEDFLSDGQPTGTSNSPS